MDQPTKSSSTAPRKESTELAARRASTMLMALTTGDCQQLHLWRGESLAAAPAPAHHQVAIDVVASSDGQGGGEDDDDAALLEARLTEGTGGSSALHVVAAAGDDDRYLESARAICCRARGLLGAPDRNGDTPLHRAARAGNDRMVAQLVGLAGGEDEVRALVRARNGRGETALHEAVRFGDLEMVGALMDGDRGLACVVADDGTSPLYLASSLGRRKIACVLHQKGDGLSYSGPDGQNALHAAVIHHKGELYILVLFEVILLLCTYKVCFFLNVVI